MAEIRIENLHKAFGDFTAVDHVDFSIAQGEIFGFLGSNGCGKSTTMKMLTAVIKPFKADLDGDRNPALSRDQLLVENLLCWPRTERRTR